nr:IS5 family transposase [Sinorhizobium medicae]
MPRLQNAGRSLPPETPRANQAYRLASQSPQVAVQHELTKIKGRKRHIVVDTLGLMVGLVVHSADIQDRDGAVAALKTVLRRWPWLRHIFADGGYAGPKLRAALRNVAKFTLQIVKRTDKAKGFEVLPRRWVVERTFAWLGRCRRLAKDWEKSIASAEAWMLIAHIRILTRRLARHHVY